MMVCLIAYNTFFASVTASLTCLSDEELQIASSGTLLWGSDNQILDYMSEPFAVQLRRIDGCLRLQSGECDERPLSPIGVTAHNRATYSPETLTSQTGEAVALGTTRFIGSLRFYPVA